MPLVRRAAALASLAALGLPGVLTAQARQPVGQSSPTLTPAIKVGNTIYGSGQLGYDRSEGADNSIGAQTTRTLQSVQRVFEQAGAKMEHAVKCTVFLVETADFQGMNQAYRAFWPSAPPARSTVVVKALVVPNATVEIECIAVVP
jgi:2-iminobutanoate/2-iminopropanoate deaminase